MLIARYSWSSGRESIFFIVDVPNKSLKLVRGTYESDGEFLMLNSHLGKVQIVSLYQLLGEWVS
jgi:hypothetical protein